MAARAACRWNAKDAAIRREMAEWEASQINERRGPGKTNSEAVEKGTHGSRVRAGRRGPYGRVDYVQARSRGKLLRGARRGSDKACQVRVEHVTILGAPVPGRRQDGGAVQQKSLYPRMQVGSGPSVDSDGRQLGVSGFEKASAEDQTGLGDKSAESQAEPGPFSGAGRRPESGKSWPGEGDLVRVSKQGSHGT